jgi:hypothetical protein
MKMLNCAALIVPMLLVNTIALATPSTHVWGPSTDVQAFKVIHITSDIYLAGETDAAGNHLPTVPNLGLTVGVLPLSKLNLEVGFDYKASLGNLDNYPIYFNTKLGIPENAFGQFFPALAVGIYDVGTKKDLTDNNLIYGKIAKSFTVGQTSLGRFSLGYFTGNEKLLLNADGDKDNAGIMVAWERTVSELSEKLWVCGEYLGTESAYGTVNFGFAWKFTDKIALLLGYDLYNNTNLPNTATVQVDIDF